MVHGNLRRPNFAGRNLVSSCCRQARPAASLGNDLVDGNATAVWNEVVP
jgi:hypothetical protein